MSSRAWRALHGLCLAATLAIAWVVWAWEPAGIWRNLSLAMLALTAFVTLTNLWHHPRPPRQLDAGADGLWIGNPNDHRRAWLPWGLVQSIRAEAVAGIPCIVLELASTPDPALREQLGIDDPTGRRLMFPGQFKGISTLEVLARRLDQLRLAAVSPGESARQPPNKP